MYLAYHKTIDFFVKLCEAVLKCYKSKVKYWTTFNEINCVKHQPYVSVGVVEENHPHVEQAKYQGAHHQFVASAKAIEQLRRIIPAAKVGTMISYSY